MACNPYPSSTKVPVWQDDGNVCVSILSVMLVIESTSTYLVSWAGISWHESPSQRTRRLEVHPSNVLCLPTSCLGICIPTFPGPSGQGRSPGTTPRDRRVLAWAHPDLLRFPLLRHRGSRLIRAACCRSDTDPTTPQTLQALLQSKQKDLTL